MKPPPSQAAKLRQLKLSEPLRGIVPARSIVKRGPQVHRSSKRPH